MADNPQQQEEDLYDDLKEAKPAPKSAKRKFEIATPGNNTDQLEKKVQQLEQENEILRRNLGTLYRTAKSEIERKDAEIERLMKQVESMN
jgi:predicted RNase H-like nuclease (RuvC/YqgF family)